MSTFNDMDAPGEAQRLAQLLRELDGDHKLGAGALAEALVAHGVSVGAESPSAPREPGFSEVNLARCTSPDGFGHALDSWSIAEWTNAAAGEMGEACNLAKKLLRHRDGVAGNKKPEDQDVESLRQRCAEELADVVIYADLAMRALGRDLNDTVRAVFNRKSEELNAPYRVTEGPLGAVDRGAPSPALDWQKIADEFCAFNPAADRVVMHNFAGWLVSRGAPSAPTKHHDYRAPVCWCGERNSGGSTPEHEGNPE